MMEDVMKRLEPALEELSEFVGRDQLEVLVSEPASYFPDDISAIIPTFALADDGVMLESFIMVSSKYLCDVRFDLSAPNTHDFDFVRRDLVYNIRVELSTHDVVVGGEVVETYQIAKVELHHPFEFLTELKYAGTSRDDWMDKVRGLFPLETLDHLVPQSRSR